MTTTFYFDYLSPFSFFLFQKLKTQNFKPTNYAPIVLAKILNHWGQKGPADIAPKRDYLFKSCLRYAKKNKIDFTVPTTHPFNSLYALRLSTKAVSEGDQALQFKIIDLLWSATWQKRIDMGDPDIITKVLNEAGLNGQRLMNLTFESAAKNEIKKNTETAISQGVFGVPSLVVNESELFWGNDSLEDCVNFIRGEDLLDRAVYEELTNRTIKGPSQSLGV